MKKKTWTLKLRGGVYDFFWVWDQVHAQAPDMSEFDIGKLWHITRLSMLPSHIYAKSCTLCSYYDLKNSWNRNLNLSQTQKVFISTVQNDQVERHSFHGLRFEYFCSKVYSVFFNIKGCFRGHLKNRICQHFLLKNEPPKPF